MFWRRLAVLIAAVAFSTIRMVILLVVLPIAANFYFADAAFSLLTSSLSFAFLLYSFAVFQRPERLMIEGCDWSEVVDQVKCIFGRATWQWHRDRLFELTLCGLFGAGVAINLNSRMNWDRLDGQFCAAMATLAGLLILAIAKPCSARFDPESARHSE